MIHFARRGWCNGSWFGREYNGWVPGGGARAWGGWSILDEDEFSQARYCLGNSWAGNEGIELRGVGRHGELEEMGKGSGLWEGLQAAQRGWYGLGHI